GSFTVTTARPNTAPVAKDDSFMTGEDNTVSGNVLDDNGNGADSDPDKDQLTVSLLNGPDKGSVSLDPDGSFTYTPNANSNGTDSFTYKLSDGLVADTATVRIRIGAIVRAVTQDRIAGALTRRARQIVTNAPDLAPRLMRRGQTRAETPVSLTGRGNSRQGALRFATSLQQIVSARTQAKAQTQAAVIGDGSGKAGALAETNGAPASDFDIWVEGQWAYSQTRSTETEQGLLYLGADYQPQPGLLIGLQAQFDWTEDEDGTGGARFEGRGYTVGPYVVSELHESLYLSAGLSWGQSENDITPLGSYTDTFDTTRWLAKARLTGRFTDGPLTVAPHVGVVYFREDQKSYTDSFGTRIPDQTVSLGLLTFGPRLSHRWRGGDGWRLATSVAMEGIWAFDQTEDLKPTGLSAVGEALQARASASIRAIAAAGYSLTGEGFYDGIGDGATEGYGGMLTLSIPIR
ncbi:Ig-like domain-containing protein, partial [Dichotomicrobium thermohalophilum]